MNVTRWRLYDLRFQAELGRQRHALWSAGAARLRALVPKATETVERALEQAQEREELDVRLALQILKMAGFDRIGTPDTPPNVQELLDQEVLRRRENELPLLIGGGPVTQQQRDAIITERLALGEAELPDVPESDGEPKDPT